MYILCYWLNYQHLYLALSYFNYYFCPYTPKMSTIYQLYHIWQQQADREESVMLSNLFLSIAKLVVYQLWANTFSHSKKKRWRIYSLVISYLKSCRRLLNQALEKATSFPGHQVFTLWASFWWRRWLLLDKTQRTSSPRADLWQLLSLFTNTEAAWRPTAAAAGAPAGSW